MTRYPVRFSNKQSSKFKLLLSKGWKERNQRDLYHSIIVPVICMVQASSFLQSRVSSKILVSNKSNKDNYNSSNNNNSVISNSTHNNNTATSSSNNNSNNRIMYYGNQVKLLLLFLKVVFFLQQMEIHNKLFIKIKKIFISQHLQQLQEVCLLKRILGFLEK